MLKLPDSLVTTPTVNPVARVLPAHTVETIADPVQELYARVAQFVKGQEYIAHVVSKLSDKTFLVKVDNAVLKMDLGTAAQVGQTLTLRYAQESPVPTFVFSQTQTKPAQDDAGAALSPAATLLGKYLKEAQDLGVAKQQQTSAVVTVNPLETKIVAQELKQAIVNSGLFYESHLDDFAHGQRSLSALLQEPQNQANAPVSQLVSQQLATLENQRIVWQGQAWPGQAMDWTIQVQEKSQEDASPQAATMDPPVVSELTLQLPHLGKVVAKLNLAGGHLQVRLMAEDLTTMHQLKSQTGDLAQAMGDHGLTLDTLTVGHHS